MPFEIPQQILDLNPRCVPIKVGRKSPAIFNWPNTSERASDIAKMSGHPDYDKYGIVLDEDMLVVDVDMHDDNKNGYASVAELLRVYGIDLKRDCNLLVESPSGGCHMYFKNDDAIELPKSTKDFPGIDFLGKGCQVIGPGSFHTENPGVYKIVKHEGKLSNLPRGMRQIASSRHEASYPSQVSDSPLDDFNTSSLGLSIIKAELDAQGYIVRPSNAADQYEFTRPGKKTSSYAISGNLNVKQSKDGRILLKNWSTNDPNNLPTEEAINLGEAFMYLRKLSSRSELIKTLVEMGFGTDTRLSSDQVDEIIRSMSNKTQGDDLEKSCPTQTLSQLKKSAPQRRPYVIHGLLRRGETMNLIAAPKTGKSWFVYNLAAKLATGGDFLGWTSPHNLKCMIVDNELHPEELAFRVGSVQDAMGLDFGDDLHFTCLRGTGVTVNYLEQKLDAANASRFDVIILDALYRFIPAGTSENDNAQMMLIYNTIDRIARTFDCSVICVHHSSKGNQSEKQVSDVGAGAGAISRAADTQVVLFPHDTDGLVCVEAITRSSETPKPRSARLEQFLWNLSEEDAVRKSENEPKQDKKKQKTVLNQMKRVARAKKVGEFLQNSSVIRPEDAQAVLGESKSVLRTLLRDHLAPSNIVEFKNYFYQRTEDWQERLHEFLIDPSTPNERES